jgi:hypothetical protein
LLHNCSIFNKVSNLIIAQEKNKKRNPEKYTVFIFFVLNADISILTGVLTPAGDLSKNKFFRDNE